MTQLSLCFVQSGAFTRFFFIFEWVFSHCRKDGECGRVSLGVQILDQMREATKMAARCWREEMLAVKYKDPQ